MVFGADTRRNSSNAFANGSNPECGNSITDTRTTRVLAPPGGSSSFSLGWDAEPQQPSRPGSRASQAQQPQQQAYGAGAPGGKGYGAGAQGGQGYGAGAPAAVPPQQDQIHGARSRVSGNSFANGSNPECGNVLTDHASTRVLAPPGGSSSISFGGGGQAPAPPINMGQGARGGYGGGGGQGAGGGYGGGGAGGVTFGERVNPQSANTFATGSNQNCGNVLTDRPTTRIRAPPGGNSSLTLG